MDYIFQDDTTCVRKGINRILKKLKIRLIPKLVVTSSTLALQAAENGMGCCIVAVGHLAYLNWNAPLKIYRLKGQDPSSCGVISLHSKTFTEEEKFCVTSIKRALLEGEKEIYRRLKEKDQSERG